MSPIHRVELPLHFTFKLNIFSLVLILLCFALQIFLNMMNATLAFCILALTSSSVPPFLLIVLPRYVNESVSSSGSPFNVIGLLFFVLAFIIFVLLLLMLSPSCIDTVFSCSVFSCICLWLCERRARSSAKSRSSNWLQGVHWIPFLLFL